MSNATITWVEALEQRTFDESHVLDVFQRDGLLHLEDDAFAIAQRIFREHAFQLVEIVPRPPRADTEKPDQRNRNADDRDRDREADGDDKVRPDQRVEFGA